MPGTTCAPWVSHLRPLQGYCSALDVLGVCTAAPAGQQWVERGASPQGTLPVPTPLVQPCYEAWAFQRGCAGCQRVGKAEDAPNLLLLVFVATSRSPSILIFMLEGAKSSSSPLCPFTHRSSLQTFSVSLLGQLCLG